MPLKQKLFSFYLTNAFAYATISIGKIPYKGKIMKKRDNLPLNYKERLNSRTSFLVSIAVLLVLCLVFNQMDLSLIHI